MRGFNPFEFNGSRIIEGECEVITDKPALPDLNPTE